MTVGEMGGPKVSASMDGAQSTAVEFASIVYGVLGKATRPLVDLCSRISGRTRDTSTPGLICRNAW